jgi:hypothetical protein
MQVPDGLRLSAGQGPMPQPKCGSDPPRSGRALFHLHDSGLCPDRAPAQVGRTLVLAFVAGRKPHFSQNQEEAGRGFARPS